MNKHVIMQSILDYFHKEGRVLKRSEYLRSGNVPVHPRLLSRYFRGRGYNTIIKMIAKAYPADWSSIGSVPVEPPTSEDAVVSNKVAPPAVTEELSPIEKLRASAEEAKLNG